jgi:glucokinase
MLSVGVDLGGTNLRAAVVDVVSGRVVSDARGPTRAEEGPDAVTKRMAALIQQAIDTCGLPPDQVTSIGIGVPGLYNPTTNHVIFLTNLPTNWRQVPLGPEIAERLGRPTVLVNDARAFTLAEATLGAARGAQTVVGVTLGTGIGGGVVLGGRLHLGLDGTAGEVGHMIVDPHGTPCGCGSFGCLEAYASGPALITLGIKAIRQGRTTSLRDLIGGDLNALTPELIVHGANQGDAIAREVLDQVGYWLGVGVANLITLFSPDAVVIGGGVAAAGEWLLRPVREVVLRRCLVTPTERVKIVLAELAGEAGVIGAAVWAVRKREESG